MEFTFYPYEGFGPVKFLMSRDEVRKIMGLPYEDRGMKFEKSWGFRMKRLQWLRIAGPIPEIILPNNFLLVIMMN